MPYWIISLCIWQQSRDKLLHVAWCGIEHSWVVEDWGSLTGAYYTNDKFGFILSTEILNVKSVYVYIYKKNQFVPHRKQCYSITKISRLILYRDDRCLFQYLYICTLSLKPTDFKEFKKSRFFFLCVCFPVLNNVWITWLFISRATFVTLFEPTPSRNCCEVSIGVT